MDWINSIRQYIGRQYYDYLKFSLLILLFPLSAKAQEPLFEKLPIQGEFFKTVYSVFQDSNGFIWFSTDIGIFRYDGKDFHQPYHNVSNTNYEIFNIHEDSKQDKWLMTYKGDVLKTQGDTLLLIKESVDERGYLTSFCETENYFIVTNYYGYLYQFDKSLNLVFETQNPLSSLEIIKIGREKLLIFGYEGVSIYHAKTRQIEQAFLLPLKNYIPRFYHNEEYIFIGLNTTLFIRRIDNYKEILKTIELPQAHEIIHISQSENQLFIGTRNGYYTLNLQDYTLSKQFLKGKAITSILKDKEGILWCTTLNNGIYFAKDPDLISYNERNGLIHPTIYTLFMSKEGEIWAGANDNIIYKFSPEFLLEDTFKIQLHRDDRITAIKEIDNEIWVASKTGIAIFNDKIIGPDLIPVRADDICFDAENNEMWLVGQFTLRVSKKELDKKRVKYVEGNTYYMSNQYGFDEFYTGNANNIINHEGIKWVGTTYGLKNIANEKINSNVIKNLELRDEVTNLAIWQNKLIFGTKSNGVFLIEGDSVSVNYNQHNSLLKTNSILSLFCKDEVVYIGTNAGLYKLEIDEEATNLSDLNAYSGIRNEKIRSIVEKDSYLYLGTDNGIIRTKLDATKTKDKLVLYLDSVAGFTQQQGNGKYLLKYPDQSLSVYLTSLHYKNPEDIVYQYRLMPKAKAWKTSNSNTLHLESLAEGAYTLEVRAKVNNIISDTRQVQLSVVPPFWRTLSFQFAIFLLISAITVFLVRNRIKKIKQHYDIKAELSETINKKLALEKKAIEMEHQALRMQMNPHFIFNTINTIKGFYAENNKLKANDYIVKFSKLLRNILDSDSKFISLEKEIEFIRAFLYLNKIRFQGNLHYNVDLDRTVNPDFVAIPPMLIQPFLENAFIHAFTGFTKNIINVKFKKIKAQLHIIVEDNGIGISPHNLQNKSFDKRRSVSIKLCRERLQLFEEEGLGKTSLDIKNIHCNEHNKGTRVTIIFPYLEL